MLLIETLVETYNIKIKKYCNSSNRKQEQARARVNTDNVTLQQIQDTINDKTDEKNDRNLSNYVANISNSDSRRPKFICFLLLLREVILNDLKNKKRYYY